MTEQTEQYKYEFDGRRFNSKQDFFERNPQTGEEELNDLGRWWKKLCYDHGLKAFIWTIENNINEILRQREFKRKKEEMLAGFSKEEREEIIKSILEKVLGCSF